MSGAIRVLYVDDDPGLLEIGKLFLEQNVDFTISTIESAPTALNLLAEEQFDAIISDYQMPGMDGIQFLIEVRIRFGKIPFILFTGKGREEVVIQAINNGADAYLQKGGDPDAQFAELTHRVRMIVAKRAAEMAVKASEEKYRRIVETANQGEKLFRTLFHEMLNGFAVHEIVLDEDGTPVDYRFIEVNPAFERMTGLRREDLAGKTVLEVLPDTEPFWIERYGRVALTGSPDHFDNYSRALDKYFEGTVYQNAPGQFTTVISNVTERRRVEEELRQNYEKLSRQELALRESEERFRGIAERISDLIIIADQEGKPTYISPSVQSILGFPPEHYIGVHANPDMFPYEDVMKIGQAMERLREGSRLEQVEFRMMKKDGSYAVFEGTGQPVFAGGTYSGVQVIARDITDRKRIEAVLRESEERYLSLFERSLDCVYIHDLKGNFIDANPAALELLGYTREDILHISFTSLIDGEQLEKARETIGVILEKGSHADPVKYRLTKKNGDYVDIETKGSLILHNGKPDAVLGVARDITERLQREEELKKSQAQLAGAMDLAHLVNWEFDVVSGIFTFDDRFYALYGTSAELEGSTRMKAEEYARKFVHPEDQYLVADEVNKAIQATDPGYVSHVEHRIVRRDGEIRFIAVRFGITKDEQGRTIGTHGANQDITERKRAEEAIQQANRKLSLLSGITRHDINNQLVVLMGFLRMLEKKQHNPECDEYFRKISAAASRISSMIRFAKEYEEIGINAPLWQDCRTIVDTAAKEAAFGTVTVNNDFPAGAGVFADPLFEKVFYNLMDNAVRYGQTIRTIRFFSETHDGNTILVCEDDGVGIPAEEKEKIFERGFGKNTGMGLALSREILAITGITIRETGEPGKGARFEMAVPKMMFRETGSINHRF